MRSALGGSSTEVFSTDGIASPGIPLLGCSPSHRGEVQAGLWEWITPYLKYLLRKRNSYIRRRKLGRAEAIAQRIATQIANSNASSFDNLQRGTKALWDEVHRIEGTGDGFNLDIPGINCTTLNEHFSLVSTDPDYVAPVPKSTVLREPISNITALEVFGSLSRTRGNSTGPDGIPVWILSSMAHLLAEPVSYLYNQSLYHSYVPPCWLRSCITPIPKIPRPKLMTDFRPISITPVLCRNLEKHILRQYLYPIITNPALI